MFEKRRERVHIADWVGRALSVTSLTSMLLMPAGTYASLQPDAAPFNPGISVEDAELEALAQQQAHAQIDTYDEKSGLTRDTGTDMQSCADFVVCGTDLGIPFTLPDGKNVAYLFGDTFAVEGPFLKDEEIPESGDQYRAQALLISDTLPAKGQPIQFDGAAGLEGIGKAPEFLGGWNMLVNDGVSLPDGSVVVSYQHTIEVENPEDHTWHTDYSGLAWSRDDKHFELIGPRWENTPDNNDPFQMWSMQLDGDYVYIVSDKTGRKPGPMMLFRTRWDAMLSSDAYEYWDGVQWGAKQNAKPILEGHFGEPSLRKLQDGTWVLGYADYKGGPKIVTRTLKDSTNGPGGTWNDPKVQLTWKQQPFLYGGFIHPESTADNLILMVSVWQRKDDGSEHGELIRYDVSHINTTA